MHLKQEALNQQPICKKIIEKEKEMYSQRSQSWQLDPQRAHSA